MEILQADKYRAKLPIVGANEINANIIQTKRLMGGAEKSTNLEGVSSKISATNVVARLSSNPPLARSKAPIVKPIAKEVKELAPLRGKSVVRPTSLLSPKENPIGKIVSRPASLLSPRDNKSVKNLEKKNTIESAKSPKAKVVEKSGAFTRKFTEGQP